MIVGSKIRLVKDWQILTGSLRGRATHVRITCKLLSFANFNSLNTFAILPALRSLAGCKSGIRDPVTWSNGTDETKSSTNQVFR